MHTLLSYCEKGSGPFNLDRIGSYQNYFWVMDGATKVFPANYFDLECDEAWYMDLLNTAILTILSNHPNPNNVSLTELLIQASNSLLPKLDAQYTEWRQISSYELPTYAIAFGRLIDKQLDYYFLADCSFIVKTAQGPVHLLDSRFRSVTNKNTKQAVTNTKKMPLYTEDDRLIEANLEPFQASRAGANKVDGYWVGSVDGKGLQHGYTGQISLSSNEILAFSDGFLPAFEVYDLVPDKNNLFIKDNLKNIIYEVRKHEHRDKETSVIRSKTHDDLSVFLAYL